MILLLIGDLHSAAININGLKMTVSKFKRGQNIRVTTVAYKSEMSSLKNKVVFLATDLCLSWPKVPN